MKKHSHTPANRARAEARRLYHLALRVKGRKKFGNRLINNRETPPRTIITREQAARRGLRFFYTRLRCSRGHLEQYYTAQGMCVTCVSILNKKYHTEMNVSYTEEIVAVNV